jgi:starch-binding outer membrane protein, SusD/RagB family
MRDVVLARLAETYFLKAEAQIALGLYADAANTVQIVINRPGNKIDAAGADLPNRLVGKPIKHQLLKRYWLNRALSSLASLTDVGSCFAAPVC